MSAGRHLIPPDGPGVDWYVVDRGFLCGVPPAAEVCEEWRVVTPTIMHMAGQEWLNSGLQVA